MLFLNLIDLSKIVLHSLKYQLLLVLYVSAKKRAKIFHLMPFFQEKQLFFALKPVSFFFWLMLGQNEHQNLVLQPFQVPCAKIWDGSIFFFITLKIEIFSIEIPGRLLQISMLRQCSGATGCAKRRPNQPIMQGTESRNAFEYEQKIVIASEHSENSSKNSKTLFKYEFFYQREMR